MNHPGMREDRELRESIYLNYLNLQDMIKFGETKNAAIVASAGAIITLIFDKLDFLGFIPTMFSFGYLFMVGAVVTSFLAIYPIYPVYPFKRSAEAAHPAADPETLRGNLHVFSDIARCPDYESFERAIHAKYYAATELTVLEKDVLRSMYTSAHIALRKFRLFKRALIFFLIGGLLIVIFGPLR